MQPVGLSLCWLDLSSYQSVTLVLADQDAELDERSTVELVKRLGFPTGLARTVINQEKTTGMRIFILDNVLCERVDIHYKMKMHCVGLFAFNPPIVFTAFTRHCTVGIYIRSRWMCNGNDFDETSQNETKDGAQVG